MRSDFYTCTIVLSGYDKTVVANLLPGQNSGQKMILETVK